jgi:hypothetical protein
MNKFLIFDLEIIKAIPPKHEDEWVDGVEYCTGWNDHANMGIACMSYAALSSENESVGCVWSSAGGDVASGIAKVFNTYKKCGYSIGGLNSRKFDDKVLQANHIDFQSDFDILDMVLHAAGMLGKAYWKMIPKRHYLLDVIASANGMTKTGHGALAPIWWQQGLYQRVINYCINDSVIERAVLRKLLAGELIDPNTNEKLVWSEGGSNGIQPVLQRST